LLSMAARHLWSVSKLQARVRRATRPERPSENSESVDSQSGGEVSASTVPPSPAVRLYSEQRGKLIVWPSAIPMSDLGERQSLAARLTTLLQALEG
jgi:hypothetical protein